MHMTSVLSMETLFSRICHFSHNEIAHLENFIVFTYILPLFEKSISVRDGLVFRKLAELSSFPPVKQKTNPITMTLGSLNFLSVYALLMYLIRRNTLISRRWPEEKVRTWQFLSRDTIIKKLKSVFFVAKLSEIQGALENGYMCHDIRDAAVSALWARRSTAGQYIYHKEEDSNNQFRQIDGAVPGPSGVQTSSASPDSVDTTATSVAAATTTTTSAAAANSSAATTRATHTFDINWECPRNMEDEWHELFYTPRRMHLMNERARRRMLADSSSSSSSDSDKSWPTTASDVRERIEEASRKAHEELDIDILIEDLMGPKEEEEEEEEELEVGEREE